MLDQFLTGRLHPIIVAVRDDEKWRNKLDLHIRDRYVNIYYRGTNFMQINEKGRGGRRLTTFFDPLYLPDPDPAKRSGTWKKKEPTAEEAEAHVWLRRHGVLGEQPLDQDEQIALHLESFDYRMKAMDASKADGRRPKREREAQQKMVRVNNVSADNEYLVCDIEYSFKYRGTEDKVKIGRIDLVAAHRNGPASPPRLALIELKYGANAIDGDAGLEKHVVDLEHLVGRRDLQRRANDLVKVVQQKLDLGLVPTAITGFDLDPPLEYIIAITKHHPKSQRLRDALVGNPDCNGGRLSWPEDVAAKVVVLDNYDDPDDENALVLRSDKMIPFEEITKDDVPEVIFRGALRDRRSRAARLAAATD